MGHGLATTDPPDALLWQYAFLCGSAFLAGVINAVAGGGTLLTFPALTTFIAPAYANATSTVALLPGSFAGAFGYRKEVAETRRFILLMLVPSALGGVLGAWLVSVSPEAFAELVPWLILTAAVLFLLQQPASRWMHARLAARAAAAGTPVPSPNDPHREAGPGVRLALVLFQFGVAVYGGYFGAGIGILMLTSLAFMGGGDIHRMNAVKTVLAAVINAASVVEFVRAGLIRWEYAGVMAAAAIAGGYTGARVARRLPARYVRWSVIVIGFGLSAYYFLREYAGV